CIRAKDPVTIDQARPRLGKITMPDLVRALRHFQTMQFAAPLRVEDAQFNLVSMFGEKREINSLAIPGCAKGIGFPRPNDGSRLYKHGFDLDCNPFALG